MNDSIHQIADIHGFHSAGYKLKIKEIEKLETYWALEEVVKDIRGMNVTTVPIFIAAILRVT